MILTALAILPAKIFTKDMLLGVKSPATRLGAKIGLAENLRNTFQKNALRNTTKDNAFGMG